MIPWNNREKAMVSQASSTEVAWLAGLLEGEGCFYLSVLGYLQIELAMTDLDVVQRAAKVGGAVTTITTRYDKRGTRKPTYRICFNGFQAIRIMEKILPYMGKRRTAKIERLIKVWGSKNRREQGLPPACHPERRHYAKQLCFSCYRKALSRKHKEIAKESSLS